MESRVVPNGFFINTSIMNEKKKHILWVGRCAPVKQPDLFIELAKRIPEKIS
jgi:glycosyltransferase involved in cell wall biosynthesis